MVSKKAIEAGTANLRRFHNDSNVQRRRAYKRMSMEKNRSEELEADGWKIFSPTVVCDRIGIKDGKVYFIEFKKPGQKLTDNQELIQNIVPDSYKVFTY